MSIAQDTALDRTADALLAAFDHARKDGDPLLRRLLEMALLRVGQRLAAQCGNDHKGARASKSIADAA